jgi:hypothetical protein
MSKDEHKAMKQTTERVIALAFDSSIKLHMKMNWCLFQQVTNFLAQITSVEKGQFWETVDSSLASQEIPLFTKHSHQILVWQVAKVSGVTCALLLGVQMWSWSVCTYAGRSQCEGNTRG